MPESRKTFLKLSAVALVAFGLLGGAAWQLEKLQVSSLWIDFLGGFHPLVLHLPIGVIVFIGIQMGWRRIRSAKTGTDDRLLWFVAALTATVSFGTGYMLAVGGGYQGEHLDRHLWSAAAFSALCWVGFVAAVIKSGAKAEGLVLVGGLIAVSVTGHYGGLMVHGDPFAAAPWMNDPQRFAKFGVFGEEVRVYDEIVHPIMGAKCMICHGPAKQNGRLRLDSFAAIMRGGEHGTTVVPGDSANSSLISVTTLPMSNDDHMPPPNRPQITAEELAGLEFWVRSGAQEDQVIQRAEAPPELLPLFDPTYRLLEDPAENQARLAAEETERIREAEHRASLAVRLAALPEKLSSGFSFEDQTSDRLRFAPATFRHVLGAEELDSITDLLTESVAVDLSGLVVSAELLRKLGTAPDLKILNLSETEWGDEVFGLLATAVRLERLNLFATKITASASIPAGGFPALQQLFIGSTEASVSALQASLPACEVVGDLELPAPAPEIDTTERAESAPAI